jgi:thioredoxin reductase
MQGFLSRDGLAPRELLAVARDEVTGYGGEITFDAVTRVQLGESDGFKVHMSDGMSVTARRLLVAAGLHDELPGVKGLQERWARDVLHCPYCHGWEVRDRQLGVLADGSSESVQYAHIVRQWSNDLVLFVPPRTLTTDQRAGLAARAITVVEGVPEQVLIADDRLVGMRLDDGRVVQCEILFVPPVFVPHNDLLLQLGCEHEGGWVVRDLTGRTTVPGVWVAGNVANPRAQVITAAGEGSAAAIALNADLVGEDIAIATKSAEHAR